MQIKKKAHTTKVSLFSVVQLPILVHGVTLAAMWVSIQSIF